MEALSGFSEKLIVPFPEHVTRVKVMNSFALHPLPVLVNVLVVRVHRLQDIRL